MDLRRLTTVLALAALAMLGTATPALAHAELKSSDPAAGASLATVPKQLVLTFSEPVSPVEITVAGSPGTQWALGQVAVEGPVVTVPVQAAVGPAGPYAIAWTVKSDDGDDVKGTINFTMTVPATTTTPPAPTTTTTTETAPPTATTPVPGNAAAPADDGGGVPPWVWVLIGIAVLLLAAVLLTRGRGAPAQSPKDDSDTAQR